MVRRAAELDCYRLSTIAVVDLHGPRVVGDPAVSPLHERQESREQLRTLCREVVALAGSLAGFPVVGALHQALIDELAQARGGD
jgi:hypothetical protein